MTKYTYLAGGIFGLTDEEAKDWRDLATEMLVTEVLNPMSRDYRGLEADDVAIATEIVNDDVYDIGQSDYVLMMAEKPSWGTAMELRVAYDRDVPVFVVCSSRPLSPWVLYHAYEVFPSLEDAITAINEEAESEQDADA